MPNIFYYFTIFSVFANLHVKALPPKDKAGTSDEQIVNSLADQMKEVLDSGEFADVQFLLLPAHKLILKNASDVFAAMFRFDAKKEKAENVYANFPVVEIPDVEAAAFKVMLSFIYTEELSELNGDNAMAALYADALSRLISSKRQKNDEEDKIIASCEIEPVLDSGIKEMIRPLPITFNELVLETKQDQILQKVMKFVKNHWPEPKHFKECESFSMTFSLNFTAEEKKCHRQ
ncbi:hypothetical protein niasHT_012751 [Heterodera trifolii]|uniref:BTB domain-containing protein n=1 Tax=Heterodera trifolii TaxID=157864 RepID=A0ABD2KVI1_9BILA